MMMMGASHALSISQCESGAHFEVFHRKCHWNGNKWHIRCIYRNNIDTDILISLEMVHRDVAAYHSISNNNYYNMNHNFEKWSSFAGAGKQKPKNSSQYLLSQLKLVQYIDQQNVTTTTRQREALPAESLNGDSTDDWTFSANYYQYKVSFRKYYLMFYWTEQMPRY